jgi:hypothetical protein
MSAASIERDMSSVREDDLDAAHLGGVSGMDALRPGQADDQERQRDGA